MSKTKAESNFKSDIKRLEEIVELLEQQEVDLENAITLYEEGVELSRKCMKILGEAELKVSELSDKLREESASKNDSDGEEV